MSIVIEPTMTSIVGRSVHITSSKQRTILHATIAETQAIALGTTYSTVSSLIQ